MKVLVIGSGGREHALVDTVARDSQVTGVYAAPGNPGMEGIAEVHPVDMMSGDAVAALAGQLGVDLVIVGPEAPLAAGVCDVVRQAGIACFGPSKQAAQLEASKSFAKEIMLAAGVPTGQARLCANLDEVKQAMAEFGPPYVIKEDGLAAGKGVLVTDSEQEALDHAAKCAAVLVEEFLGGPEVSLFCITDGTTVLPMQAAQDFKRVGEGDIGLNTGGMGAYSPLPWAPPGLVAECVAKIVQPTVDEMAARGTPFVGLLYAGLVLTAEGAKVIEFNARFGDPEAQPLLMLLESGLAAPLYAAATGRLREVEPLRFHPGAAVGVVVAAEGYPEKPQLGTQLPAEQPNGPEVKCFHAGTARDDQGNLVISGGRVLCEVARGSTLESARDKVYAALQAWPAEGVFWRRDIAEKAVRGEIFVDKRTSPGAAGSLL